MKTLSHPGITPESPVEIRHLAAVKSHNRPVGAFQNSPEVPSPTDTGLRGPEKGPFLSGE